MRSLHLPINISRSGTRIFCQIQLVVRECMHASSQSAGMHGFEGLLGLAGCDALVLVACY
jgi:hypothetical protein